METGNTFKFEKVIDISLPEEEIEDLVHIDVLSHDEGSDDASGLAETYATNASLNRAVYWITTTDCANITAWRSGNKRAINDANNRELQETLRAMGYGVIKLQGFYAEVGHDVSKENSFLVFDQNDDPNFYDNLRMLSEKFDQDCFLFKAADDDVAYLIGTNEDFIRENGERSEAGRLRIGNIDAITYSEIGSGRISFE
jgi:hypothetical protein